jgi:hypothetical protein
MSKENRSHEELVAKLQQARALLDECIGTLQGAAPRKSKRGRAPEPRMHQSAPAKFDFDANERAFMKSHAKGLSGPKRFTLLVAFLAKGKPDLEVELKDVENRWNKMTRLMGGKFNRFYSNSAKDNGWVNTKKQGVYVLTSRWQNALGKY